MQGKQAKIVSPTQERAILGYLVTTRYPARDRVMFLLSMKAGLRAKEMASLTWAMVTDAQGEQGDAGDYAATGIPSTSRSMSGYQRLKMTPSSPFSVRTRVCNNKCAPSL